MDLELYKTVVAVARQKRSSFPIFNATLAHAKILIDELVADAEETICMVTGDCFPGFLDQVLLRVAQKMKKKPALEARILICSKIPEGKKQRQCPGVDIRYLEQDIPELRHFLIVDERGYRIESPHPPLPEGGYRSSAAWEEWEEIEVRAVGSFNKAQFATEMASLFEKLWELGRPSTVTDRAGN